MLRPEHASAPRLLNDCSARTSERNNYELKHEL